MKLSAIYENRSRMPITQAGKAFGDIIKYLKDNYDPKSDEVKALYNFFKKPSPKSWLDTKWIIDSISKNIDLNSNDGNRVKSWMILKALTPPTIAASVFDIDQKLTKGTPLANKTLPKSKRDNLKKNLGHGYIGLFSSLQNVSDQKIRGIEKGLSKNRALTNLIKKDYPNYQPVNRL
jgi:hypothetical protein